MDNQFLLYGANGFVGQAMAREAVRRGMRPVVGGRNEGEIRALAHELDLDYRIFPLEDAAAIDETLANSPLVLHCAGPFVDTFGPMLAGCLRNGAHYLDLTGEIPVYQAIHDYDEVARERDVMLLPGAGFDVVATDCLAVHLQKRLPSATKLSLAFHAIGPASLPPGTIRTFFKLIPYGDKFRQRGRLVSAPRGEITRTIDFGQGPREATLLTWGDIFTAFYSTGIPDIEDYIVLPSTVRRLMQAVRYARPLFANSIMGRLLRNFVKAGSTAEEQARTRTHVWGEVVDDRGGRAVARLHGPEAGVVWTVLAALDVVEQVLSGNYEAGFQTPGSAYGPELTLEAQGIDWEDVV